MADKDLVKDVADLKGDLASTTGGYRDAVRDNIRKRISGTRARLERERGLPSHVRRDLEAYIEELEELLTQPEQPGEPKEGPAGSDAPK